MKIIKVVLCFFIILSFVSCGKGEFMNLYAFTENYNEVSESKINLSDFYYESSQNSSYTAVIGDSDKEVLLNLKSEKSDIIEEVSLSIIKCKNNPPDNIQVELFRKVLTNVLKAYCSYDDYTANDLILAFNLNEYQTYIKEGELTLKKDNFYFIYYSTELISQVKIYDTYLHKIETTEKPISKPYYAEDFIIKETP
jgi:hypothetical protein